MTNLNLLVIRAKQPAHLAAFYSNLGLDFTSEQHGSGPEHFCSNHDGSVFEIYPQDENHPSTLGTRLGFAVDSIDKIIASIRESGAQVISSPATSPWGRRAVLIDPEGHRVELLEQRHSKANL